jgi:hypothetical protein
MACGVIIPDYDAKRVINKVHPAPLIVTSTAWGPKCATDIIDGKKFIPVTITAYLSGEPEVITMVANGQTVVFPLASDARLKFRAGLGEHNVIVTTPSGLKIIKTFQVYDCKNK